MDRSGSRVKRHSCGPAQEEEFESTILDSEIEDRSELSEAW